MSPPLRTRNKPLRTYGKRTASVPEEQGDAPLKKRRTESTDAPLSSPKSSTPVLSSPAPTSKKRKHGASSPPKPSDTSPKTIKKGSILNFFKPIPTPSPLASSCPNSDDVRPTSTPPSSPPPPVLAMARRKPRLLRFRGGSMPERSAEDLENDQENEAKPLEDIERDLDGGEDDGERKASRPPLQDRRNSLSNHERNQDSANPSKEKKLSRSKPLPTVQTTLNISTQAPFSECKVCNTVWNPLHPGDVKFHLKQHASVLRAKRKSEKNEL